MLAHAVSGGRATFVCFGQTGTGKTYTVHGVQLAIATALFGDNASSSNSSRHVDNGNASSQSGSQEGDACDASSSAPADAKSPACLLPQGTVVDVSAFELRGRQARDLLANGKPVKLLQVPTQFK